MNTSRQTTEKYYGCIALRCFLLLANVELDVQAQHKPDHIAYLDEETFDVDEEKDRDMQQALLDIKGKYGKNSILRGISYREKATGKIRNTLIGGYNGG